VAKPFIVGVTNDVQKPSGQDDSARKRRLVSHENERKVRLEGRHNPLDGAIEESLNILYQDNSLAYYSSKEGGNTLIRQKCFSGLEARHGEMATKGYQATYSVCGPCHGHVVMEMVSI
jgi:hypothetical protein